LTQQQRTNEKESITSMMIWLKKLSWAKLLSWILAFTVTSLLLFPVFPVSQSYAFTDRLIPVAQAQDIVGGFRQLLERTGIYSPPQGGTPPTGRQVGGAGRGPICALAQNELDDRVQSIKTVKALVPVAPTNEVTDLTESQLPELQPLEASPGTGFEAALEADIVGGLTVAERPTFWFYLPYVSTSETPQNRIAQFVLLDDTDRPVWNELMAIELSDAPRLVEYPLSHPLITGELYTWHFSVICDADKLSRNPVVRGWIQRVEPTPELQTALRNASRFDQYLAYANHMIWFDTVSSLVEIRRQFPSTNREAWLNLVDYFQIPRINQFDVLEPVKPVELEVIRGNQLPARM